jgi:PIN domain nuclease of toxin-antitoxin system
VKYLLDTHLLIWSAFDDDRLPKAVIEILNDASHELVFSVVSIWETAIKQSLGRSDFQADADILRNGLLAGGYEELRIESKHAFEVRSLPHLHRDPFDRMLIAQAKVERLTLLTSDTDIQKYAGPIRGFEIAVPKMCS